MMNRFRTTVEIGLPLIVLALLCYLETPQIFHDGRFWGEEGSIFFAQFQTKSLLEQLFFPFQGHLLILVNLSVALAAAANLGWAALVTTYAGGLLTALLICLIVIFRSDLKLDYASAFLIALLLVLSPNAAENYFNATNTSWTASVITFVVILLPPNTIQQNIYWLLPLMILNGLAGVQSAALAPIAALAAILNRSWFHGIIAATLGTCALIQLLLIKNLGTDPLRAFPTDPQLYLIAPYIQIFIKQLLGVHAAGIIGAAQERVLVEMKLHPQTVPLLIAAATILLGSLVLIVRQSHVPILLCVVGGWYVVWLNIFGSIGDPAQLVFGGMRYFFLPTLAVWLIIAMSLNRPFSKISISPAAIILGYITLVAVVDFYTTFEQTIARGPSWSAELRKCPQQARRCKVAIWPPGWYADIIITPAMH